MYLAITFCYFENLGRAALKKSKPFCWDWFSNEPNRSFRKRSFSYKLCQFPLTGARMWKSLLFLLQTHSDIQNSCVSARICPCKLYCLHLWVPVDYFWSGLWRIKGKEVTCNPSTDAKEFRESLRSWNKCYFNLMIACQVPPMYLLMGLTKKSCIKLLS